MRFSAVVVALSLYTCPVLAFKVASITVAGVHATGEPIHEKITEDGLKSVIYRLSNGKSISFDASAIDQITASNVATDSHDWDLSWVHFDDEQLNASSFWLVNLREAVVKWAAAGDYSLAQQVLGMGLHTLQDFYAHSTWVERQSVDLAPLGRSVLENPIAATANCTAFGLIAGAPLTTGYFNLSQLVPSLTWWTFPNVHGWPTEKCIHGTNTLPG